MSIQGVNSKQPIPQQLAGPKQQTEPPRPSSVNASSLAQDSLKVSDPGKGFAQFAGKGALGPSQLFMSLFSQYATPANVVDGEFIVKLAPGQNETSLKNLLSSLGKPSASEIQGFGKSNVGAFDNLYRIKFNTGMITPRQALVVLLGATGVVEFAEPNYKLKLAPVTEGQSAASPGRSSVDSRLWGHHNTGQGGGQEDADIDFPEAQTTMAKMGPGKNVTVAVIDSGVDLNHPELQGRLWINDKEVPDDGVDNDNNGYIDDRHGWDFVGKDNQPLDENGHGTHVSGTIAGQTTGVSPHARIMAVRFLDKQGSGNLADALLAVKYAVDNGAQIMNNSWGGGAPSRSMWDAIDGARQKGSHFIAAAGNESNNNDANPAYPASYTLSNVLSVAATTRQDQLADFSNHGQTAVDVGAPGKDIHSAWPGGGYKTISGTSMATPYISGVAAEILAMHPSESVEGVQKRLLNGDAVAALEGKTFSGKRVNLNKSVSGEQAPAEVALPPSQNTPPASFPSGPGTIRLRAIGGSVMGGVGSRAIGGANAYALVEVAPILSMEAGLGLQFRENQTIATTDVGFRLHPVKIKQFEPYLGVGATYMASQALAEEPGQFGGYLKLGTEYYLNKHWALDASVGYNSYMSLSGSKMDHFATASAGINYHF